LRSEGEGSWASNITRNPLEITGKGYAKLNFDGGQVGEDGAGWGMQSLAGMRLYWIRH